MQVPTVDDCKAAIAELNSQVATLSMRAVDMAVALSKAQRELADAHAEIAQLKEKAAEAA